METWKDVKTLKEKIISRRKKGEKLDDIASFVKAQGYKCSSPELCNFFNEQGIKPLKNIDFEGADIDRLSHIRDTVYNHLRQLEKEMKTKPELSSEYRKLLDTYKQLSGILKDSKKVSKAETNYKELKALFLELYELMPSAARYINDRILGKSKEKAAEIFKSSGKVKLKDDKDFIDASRRAGNEVAPNENS